MVEERFRDFDDCNIAVVAVRWGDGQTDEEVVGELLQCTLLTKWTT